MIWKWIRLKTRPTNDGIPPDGAVDLVSRSDRPFARNPSNVESGLLSESGTPVNSVARIVDLANTGVGIDGEVFGIGDYYFELNASDGTTPSNAGADPVAAVGAATLTGVPANNDTITVGATTYTFKAAGASSSGEVSIGSTAGQTANYLASAINGDDNNVAHASATAEARGSVVFFTSKYLGAGGGALVLTESAANLTVNGAGTLGGTTAAVDPQYFPVDITATADKAQGTLTLSSNPSADETITLGATVYTWKVTAANAGEVTLGSNALNSATNLVASINGTDGINTANASASAAGGGGGTVIATALVGGTAGNSIVSTETMSAGAWDAATLGTTTAGTDTTANEVVDAVVSTITALNSSGDVPFTAADQTATAAITSDLHGTVPNGYPLYEAMANATLAQDTAGVAGTEALRGALMDDGTNLYLCRTATHEDAEYVWREIAHSAI